MSVCQNQDTFNQSLRQAIKYNEKQDRPKKLVQLILLAIYMIFIVWALLLASKVSDVEGRKLHFVLAMVFSPIYIIAYYLGGMQ